MTKQERERWRTVFYQVFMATHRIANKWERLIYAERWSAVNRMPSVFRAYIKAVVTDIMIHGDTKGFKDLSPEQWECLVGIAFYLSTFADAHIMAEESKEMTEEEYKKHCMKLSLHLADIVDKYIGISPIDYGEVLQ